MVEMTNGFHVHVLGWIPKSFVLSHQEFQRGVGMHRDGPPSALLEPVRALAPNRRPAVTFHVAGFLQHFSKRNEFVVCAVRLPGTLVCPPEFLFEGFSVGPPIRQALNPIRQIRLSLRARRPKANLIILSRVRFQGRRGLVHCPDLYRTILVPVSKLQLVLKHSDENNYEYQNGDERKPPDRVFRKARPARDG